MMLQVRGLCAGYGGEDVIRGVSFDAERGKVLCILGPNGCGKSTLLKSIARVINSRGEVSLDGRGLSSFSRKELARQTALLGQTAQIFFPYTVRETVALGRYAYTEGFFSGLSADDKRVIDNTIEKLNLTGIAGRMIDRLSGGQLQRVLLAKTLVQDPPLVLLDEPTNHLDLKSQIELLSFLKEWITEKGKALIAVFHDLNLARFFGDSALLLNGGEVAALGDVAEVLDSEKTREVYGIDAAAFMRESLAKWEKRGGEGGETSKG